MDWLTAWVYAGLRAAAQALIPSLGGTLALLPPEQRDALVVALVTVAGAAVMGAFVAAIRWLETRTGNSLGARLARFAGHLVMIGLDKFQPAYAARSASTVPAVLAVRRADNVPVSQRGVPTSLPVLKE